MVGGGPESDFLWLVFFWHLFYEGVGKGVLYLEWKMSGGRECLMVLAVVKLCGV